MTAMRSERLGGDKDVPEKPGPEKFAPPDRRPPERLSEINQAAANAVEGEIREFVRRDVAFLRRQRSEGDGGDGVSDNLNSLIRRVSGASMEEIDRVILELQGVRDMLRNEGERVSREIAGYASLSHAAMTAMKVIGDSLKQWKEGPNGQPEPSRRPPNDPTL
jgi:hypothetical protein